MSLSLYRKYRPQNFSDVIGQKHIVQTLSNAIEHDRISHAYLFTGPRGTGKTTLARIFARTVNCLSRQSETAADQSHKMVSACLKCEVCQSMEGGKSLDIFEIDAASNTGVDNIRELRENVKFPPTMAKYKVYIIDEVHMLSAGAFNALLKTLEEPPAHVIFILATTEIHKVPDTIISRCQRFDFAKLTIEQIIEKLSQITTSENISIEKEALEMIALAAEGGMRDGESILSQIISLEDKNITARLVADVLGTIEHESLFQMSQYLLQKDAGGAILLLNKISEEGSNLEFFNKALTNILRQLMIVATDKKLAELFSHELTKQQLDKIADIAESHSPKEILKVLNCFVEIQGKIRSAYIPQLPLEMAIVKSLGGCGVEVTENVSKKDSSKLSSVPVPAEKNPVEIKDAPVEKKIVAVEEKEVEKIEIVPETSESTTPSAESLFTLSDVKKSWNDAIAQIKPLNHSLAAVLPNCQPVKVEGGVLTIAAKFAFHKDKLNEHKNKLTVETVFDKILGSKVIISVVTAQEAGIEIKSSAIQQSQPKTEEKPKETSSLLTDAMGILGGQIVG